MPQPDDWDFLQYRAQHGRLERVEATISHHANGRRSKLAHLQAVADKRLLDALEPQQLEAMDLLCRSIKAVSGALDIKPPKWERTDKSAGQEAVEDAADLSGLYWRFLKGCEDDRIDARPAIMICGHGWSLRACEKKCQRGRLAVLKSFHDALDVMAGIR